MTYQDFASQLPYAFAAVLICSALLKSILDTVGEIRSINNVDKKEKYSPRNILRPIGHAYMSANRVWRIELLLALAVILFCPYTGPIRAVTQVAMALMFAAFCVICVVDLRRHSDKPCHCFGNLSKKAPRRFSCIRNGLCCGASLIGLMAHAASISIEGIVIVAIVLGVILYEEIR